MPTPTATASATVFLRRTTQFLTLPLPPELQRLKPTPAVVEHRPVVRAWNRFGGLLAPICDSLQLSLGCALAVLCVESGGSGFGPDGRLKIRFEVHHFVRAMRRSRIPSALRIDEHFRFDAAKSWLGHQFRAQGDKPWRDVHRSQAAEWEALDFARSWDEPAVLAAASFGAPQILGSNAAVIGYASPLAMLRAFSDAEHGERFQLLGFFDFLRHAHPRQKLLELLHQQDFQNFARFYNGAGQAPAYAQRIARSVETWKQIAVNDVIPSPSRTGAGEGSAFPKA